MLDKGVRAGSPPLPSGHVLHVREGLGWAPVPWQRHWAPSLVRKDWRRREGLTPSRASVAGLGRAGLAKEGLSCLLDAPSGEGEREAAWPPLVFLAHSVHPCGDGKGGEAVARGESWTRVLAALWATKPASRGPFQSVHQPPAVSVTCVHPHNPRPNLCLEDWRS